MNKQKRVIIGVILVAILLMAVGYAAITEIPLTIKGTATAAATQDNFKVYFSGETTLSDANVTTSFTETETDTGIKTKTIATVNIAGLVKKDDSKYAILEIENGSNNVDAESVLVSTEVTDTTIFDIDVVMCDSEGKAITNYEVKSGEKTYVKVSATLLQTPTSDASADINVSIIATPKAAV